MVVWSHDRRTCMQPTDILSCSHTGGMKACHTLCLTRISRTCMTFPRLLFSCASFFLFPDSFFFSSSHSSTRRSNVSKRITDDGKVSRGGKLLQTFFVHPFNARRSKIVILLSFSWRRVLSLSLFFKRSHSRLEKEKETRVSLIMIHIIRLEYFVSSAY